MADIGKIRGHVSEAKRLASADAQQREEAGRGSNSVILNKREVQGEWDASRVLTTTLGGKREPITADHLAQFRHNMRVAQKNFKGEGITARQVIDLASSHPLAYAPKSNGISNGSDLTKSRREITMAVPVSARNGEVRFMTNAGKDSDVSRHHVLVRFNQFNEAANKLMATKAADRKDPKQAANWLRKQKLAFDCDCGRHRYFFRYVATIGNFNAGRKELGYPKIRNPGLKGVACKHVLRVMAEIDSSGSVWSFLTKHMQRLVNSSDNTARTQQTQKEAEKASKGRARDIKTSEQRTAERKKAKEKSALKAAAANPTRLQKKPVATRKIEAAMANGKVSEADMAVFRKFGMSDTQIMNILKGK